MQDIYWWKASEAKNEAVWPWRNAKTRNQLLEDYYTVVNWISVRPLFATTKIYKLKLWSIDFVLAFPQADLNVNVYMELPISIYAPNGGKSNHVLNFNKSLYVLKQAGTNWF